MKRRKHTTTAEDMAFLAKVYNQVHKQRQVGDEVKVYQGGGRTSKIAKIEGDIVTLEDGSSMHISNCRDPGYDPSYNPIKK